jgi:hypothetical protein
MMCGAARNLDILEVLAALAEGGAEFLVVGANAVPVHGVPRETGRDRAPADARILENQDR